ncbi:MAG: IS21-like element helper ATPase IstB [Kiritimatiellia bacterium]|nr:IS21-like element helper ATPase IstB [Kiritimatiellia bacterium]
MLNEQTMTQLYAMKLNGMANGYEEQRRQPKMADLSFDERLGMLVDQQWRWREERSLTTRLQNAKFKLQACLEDLDYRTSRGLKRAQIDQLSNSAWVGYHQNLILTGPTGTGKTFLACALGQKACRDGHRVRYYVAAKLFRELTAAHADGSFSRLSAQLVKSDLLLIDDWGMETLRESEYRDFLEILDDRQGSGSTLITSQFPTEVWHDTIGNPTVADAILDRLVHNSHRIVLGGESMRKPKGKTS